MMDEISKSSNQALQIEQKREGLDQKISDGIKGLNPVKDSRVDKEISGDGLQSWAAR